MSPNVSLTTSNGGSRMAIIRIRSSVVIVNRTIYAITPKLTRTQLTPNILQEGQVQKTILFVHQTKISHTRKTNTRTVKSVRSNTWIILGQPIPENPTPLAKQSTIITIAIAKKTIKTTPAIAAIVNLFESPFDNLSRLVTSIPRTTNMGMNNIGIARNIVVLKLAAKSPYQLKTPLSVINVRITASQTALSRR